MEKKEYDKAYREKNKKHLKKMRKIYEEQNQDDLQKYQTEYYQKNKDKKKADRKLYVSSNRNKINRYERIKREKDLDFRLAGNMRSRLRRAIDRNQKAGSVINDLGSSIDELKSYLEKQFYNHPVTNEAMSWSNYGISGWHIDHIKPLSGFDLTDREQFLKACHYTNLQPLWAEDNLCKGSKNKLTRRKK